MHLLSETGNGLVLEGGYLSLESVFLTFGLHANQRILRSAACAYRGWMVSSITFPHDRRLPKPAPTVRMRRIRSSSFEHGVSGAGHCMLSRTWATQTRSCLTALTRSVRFVGCPKRGMLDEQVQSWSGWLGRYHAALRNKAEIRHGPARLAARASQGRGVRLTSNYRAIAPSFK